ncbi:Auxin-responsive protein [Actinidia chinensis var. chinensis]|uniref:Auxin-responsive protein n=1 Tax=Actinidia chinensis var. chinensis TaxID=1590841 RepID=A0A2R6Q8Q7_ACTCC|nr:Auxin-responsive protein [Actinidia chinensis var. chinensis]
MNSFDSQRQESMKRMWQERMLPKNPNNLLPTSGCGFDDDLVSSHVVPPVTVVLEGRSICQRISLHKHSSYHSLAKAIHQMFVDGGEADSDELDLSNAIPGYLIAYEDMENDLLLVGDLNWEDFVRVARRIRILPVKANSRKRRGGD